MRLYDLYNIKEAVMQNIKRSERKVEIAENNLLLARAELDFLDELENEILERMKLEANYDAETSTLLEDVLASIAEEA